VALPGVMASTVDHGSIVSAPRASERARRGSGNSSGLGKAEASGTTSRDLADSRIENTRSLTRTGWAPVLQSLWMTGSGGSLVLPAVT